MLPIVAACAGSGRPSQVAVDVPVSREINIPAMTAAYRYLFDNNGSALKDAAATYCVGVGSGQNPLDPSPALLADLVKVSSRVRPASTCRIDARVTDGADKPSLLFEFEQVACDTADDCLLQGGYYEGNVGASAGRYRVRRVAGEWQVTPEGPQAVS